MIQTGVGAVLNTAKMLPGETAIVFGLGGIGLNVIQGAKMVGADMIVGVDRLDYSKGLEERFLGYERFLVEHPEERKEVTLLQIAPPSRAPISSVR